MLYNSRLYKIYCLFFSLLLLSLTGKGALYAQQTGFENNIAKTDSILTHHLDSVKSVSVDTLRGGKKSDEIKSEVAYTANDSIVLLGNGTGILYGSGDVKYEKINLKADFIRVKMDSSLVYAHGIPDSLGVLQGNPEFSEGDKDTYSAKQLTYNLKTQKGFIRQAVTQQGEGYILSDAAKKSDANTFCMIGGKYTTCDDHDDPHFYLSLSKAKVDPGSYIVTGPVHMVLLGVPIPVWIPFGYFPMNTKYSSGIESPNFETDYTRGYGLVNGGYYFAFNDYVDLDIRGDLYTRGTWAVNLNSSYLRRYKYNGSVAMSYREDVTGDPDLSNYSKSKNFSIRWSHTQNTKVNPYRTFSSSVNFSTSGYDKSNINSYYTAASTNNQKSSSISFSQRFPDNPFSLSGSILASQRASDSTITLTLPNLSISMSRIYPFKRKNVVGKERWYEKISMSYSGSLTNSFSGKEYNLFHSSITKDWINSMSHSIPISASFSMLKFITLTTGVGYRENWALKSYRKAWDTENDRATLDTVYGFARNYDFSVNTSASTTLYGFYTPSPKIFGDKIIAIRHVFTPSIGFSYHPDFTKSFWGMYDSYLKTETYKDAQGDEQSYSYYQKYNKYTGSDASSGVGQSGAITYSFGNNLEMKVRDTKDTTNVNATKIISLIDNFSLSGSYNMAADSLNWSNISATIRIKFGKLYTLNLSTTFDPYMYKLNAAGRPYRSNAMYWNYGKIPRFMGTGTSFSYSLSNNTFSKKNKKKEGADGKNSSNDENSQHDDSLDDMQNSEHNHAGEDLKPSEKKSNGYDKIEIPWNLSLSYNVSYRPGSVFDYDKMNYKMVLSHYASLSGSIKLTPGWSITGSSNLDITAKKVTYTNFNITRNLHCWTLTGSMVPFGPYKSYSFKIGVNASMLQDLKYERNSTKNSSVPVDWY